MKNKFELYESKDGWEKVSKKIDNAIKKIESDIEALDRLMEDNRHFGATDTVSRYAIAQQVKDRVYKKLKDTLVLW